MAKFKSITSAQNDAANIAAIDLLGESKDNFQPVKFDRVAQSVEYLASLYVKKLVDNLRDHNSSGELADSIEATEVEQVGTVVSVGILAPDRASYLDEGVSGWAKDRGSRFQFKTKGIDPEGEMVRSVKAWLEREGKIAQNTPKPVTAREQKRDKIKDASTKAAISTAYMIKRMGIKPTLFWQKAKKDMQSEVEKELAAALKIDIINSFNINFQ